MASVSEDENVPVEETGDKRRTRSGRKTAMPIPTTATPLTPSRSTRRTRRTAVDADTQHEHMRAEDEPNADAKHELPIGDQCSDQSDHQLLDSSASSFPDMSASSSHNNEQSSAGTNTNTDTSAATPTTTAATDSIDNLLANLAEDNANSLPSGDDGESDEIGASARRTANGDITAVVAAAVAANAVKEANATVTAPAAASDEMADDTDDDNDDDADDDDHAMAEQLPNGAGQTDSQTTSDAVMDAEMVSEDELPSQPTPMSSQTLMTALPVTVDDAEEVSDEELPGPRLAELPADTEVVSEDELPSSNKTKRKVDEDYDPGSPTESSDLPGKRAKSSGGDVAATTIVATASKEKEKKEEKKTLPELEKYWKAVRTDPADFTGWTYLLQYVDQENDIEAARVAYDAFLGHYPYCYGYWRKYADYEKRKGNKDKCEEMHSFGDGIT